MASNDDTTKLSVVVGSCVLFLQTSERNKQTTSWLRMGLRSRSAKTAKASAKANAKSNVKANVAPQPQPPQRASGHLLQRAFNSQFELSAEDVLSVAYWIRQVLALLVGVIFGFMQLTGFTAILGFLGAALMAPTAMLSMFRELDFDDINKRSSLQTEGIAPALALFILTWTISYTVFLPQPS